MIRETSPQISQNLDSKEKNVCWSRHEGVDAKIKIFEINHKFG